MKTATLANGDLDNRIDTHSLRAGGATALYTHGVPLDVILRFGEMEISYIHQYLRCDSTALNTISEIVVRSHGLLKFLKLMYAHPEWVSFQDKSEKPAVMAENSTPRPAPDQRIAASMVLPNDRFLGGSPTSSIQTDAFTPSMSDSDFPRSYDSSLPRWVRRPQAHDLRPRKN